MPATCWTRTLHKPLESTSIVCCGCDAAMIPNPNHTPGKKGAPFLARLGREKLALSLSNGGDFLSTCFRLQAHQFAAIRSPSGASPARHRSASRKWRLRPDRPRSRRSAAASRTSHPADHMVPLPPRRREQTPQSCSPSSSNPSPEAAPRCCCKLGAAEAAKNAAPGLSRGLDVMEAPEERKKNCTCGYPNLHQTATTRTCLTGLEYHRRTDPFPPGTQTRSLGRVRNQNRLGWMKHDSLAMTK